MTATTSPPSYDKPLPKLSGMTREFYGWLKKHELRFQRCSDCGRWRHVPRELCPECGSTGWEWGRSAGKGRIFTWSTTYRPLHPAFTDTPFAQVVVEFEEGPRLMTAVTDVAPEDLEVDMPVEVVFDDVTSEITLAKVKRGVS